MVGKPGGEGTEGNTATPFWGVVAPVRGAVDEVAPVAAMLDIVDPAAAMLGIVELVVEAMAATSYCWVLEETTLYC